MSWLGKRYRLEFLFINDLNTVLDENTWFASNMNDKTHKSILYMAKVLFFALQLRLKKDE